MSPATQSYQQLIVGITVLTLALVVIALASCLWVIRAMRQIANRSELLRSIDVTVEAGKRREELEALRLSLVSYVDQLNASLDRHEAEHGRYAP